MKRDISKIMKAYNFASDAHKDQKRKGGHERYFNHPSRIGNLLYRMENISEKAIMAALLHDVVEDCNINLNIIRKEFGLKVHDLVDLLTEAPKGVKNRRKIYEDKLLSSDSKEAILIKILDIQDNLRDVFGCFEFDNALGYSLKRSELMVKLIKRFFELEKEDKK